MPSPYHDLMKFVLASAVGIPLLLTALLTSCGTNEPETPSINCSALSPQTGNAISLSPGPVVALSNNPSSNNWTAPHVPGRVLINTTATLSAQSLSVLSTLAPQQIVPGLHSVATPAGLSDAAYAAKLQAAGLHTQPDFLYQSLSTVNDPGFPTNSGIAVQTSDTVLAHQDYLNRIKVGGAWDVLTRCGLSLNGARTAVIDSGIDDRHPDLQGRVVAHTSFLQDGDAHTLAHATAVAGIIGATANNDLGLSGIGQAQEIISEEVTSMNGASTSAVTRALADAVKQGAKVINMSLGLPTSAEFPVNDPAMDKAIQTAAKSAVLVAAAGNSAVDVYYPANRPEVIAVGAVASQDGVLACYSARPSTATSRALDIVAPGGNGYACPDSSPEQHLLVLAPNGSYALETGTSFAAPQVAGVAALMRAANPKLSAEQTRNLLLKSVNQAAGLPMLDAEAAVTAAIRGQ